MTRMRAAPCFAASLLALAIPAFTFGQAALAAPAPAHEPAGAEPARAERLPLAELRRKFGAPDDKYVTVGGVELRYRDEGEGPVLLLLHGSRSTLNQWDGVANRLKGHYRIVRFDMPPTGLSGPVSDAAVKEIGSPDALVARLLDKLGIDKVNVAGVSSGGTLAYYFAAANPGRVENLILSNTPSNPVPGLKLEVPADLAAATERVKQTGIEGRDFWSSYLASLYGVKARLDPALPEYYYQTNLRVKEPNARALFALTADNATTMERLKAVRAPVLILWGMSDYVLKPQEGRDLESYLVNASSRSFVALDTVGHYPPMESPEAVADLIDAYIRRNR